MLINNNTAELLLFLSSNTLATEYTYYSNKINVFFFFNYLRIIAFDGDSFLYKLNATEKYFFIFLIRQIHTN